MILSASTKNIPIISPKKRESSNASGRASTMNCAPSGNSDCPDSIIAVGSGIAVGVGVGGTGVAVGLGVAVGAGVAVGGGGTGVAVAVGGGMSVGGAEVAVGSEPQAATTSSASKAIPAAASRGNRKRLRSINPPDQV